MRGVTESESEALLARPLLEAPLVALDVETTGLSPARGDRIIEIALVRREPGEASVGWSVLVDPERPIPPAATRVHGIVDDHLIAAPTFSAVADEVLEHLEDAALVAHNAPFDLSFLDAELARLERPRPALPVIDTLRLARRHFDFPSNDLATVCRSLGVALEGAHRAEADAAATLEALLLMAGPLAEAGQRTVGDLSRRSGAAGRRRAGPELLERLEQALDERLTVTLHYPGRNGRLLKREVAVYRLAGNALEGWCYLRGDRRSFRLDRIARVEPAGRSYEPPADLTAESNETAGP
jgi:DNA polymerase III epsilon subunit